MTGVTNAPPSRAKVVAAFLALYVVWGSTYLFIKWTVVEIPPFLMGAMRHGTAGIILFAIALSSGAPRPTRHQWGVAALVGIMLLGLGNGMVNWASQRVPSGLAALIVSSVPIWIVLVDWLRPGGVRPTRRIIAGLALGSLGIAGLVWSAGGARDPDGSGTGALVACLGLIVGSISWAGGSILSRQLRRQPHGVLATSMEMVCAGAALTVVSLLIGDFATFDVSAVSSSTWWALAYLIIAGSLIGFTAYTWLLRVSTPSKVATYAYVNPVVAVALGWGFGGERLAASTFVAAAFLLAAVATLTLPAWPALRQVFEDR
jgi:drug/metabolite transporter (DMT)-like permease